MAADQLRVTSVTGVEMNLDVAGPGARAYAFVIDWHIRLIFALGWLLSVWLLGRWMSLFSVYFDYFLSLSSLALYFLYHPVIETLTRGSTPGKRLAGIKIVTDHGDVPGVGALLIRNVFRLIDCLPAFYPVGLAATLLTRHNQRIGDLAAGTLLVYDRKDGASIDELEQLQSSPLGVQQSELVQDLLARWKELDPPVRLDFGRRVLSGLGSDVATADENEVHRQLTELLGLTAQQSQRIRDLLGRWEALAPPARIEQGRALLGQLGRHSRAADHTALRSELERLLDR